VRALTTEIAGIHADVRRFGARAGVLLPCDPPVRRGADPAVGLVGPPRRVRTQPGDS